MTPRIAVGSGLGTWVQAARVPTLPAAVVPVLVGTAAAIPRTNFKALPFVAALCASLLIQIGTNLANDYYDFHKGADTAERVGPIRITAAGTVSPRQVLTAALLSFGLAAVIGLYLVAVGGWPILVVGLASILAGLAYTGGPYPLGYNGLGDVFVFVFFGLVAVLGSFYLQAGHLAGPAVVAALPVAFLVTAILVVNNIRDADTDRKAGKMTLAARFGVQPARLEFTGLVMGSYVFPLVLMATGIERWWIFWLPYCTLPLSIPLVKTVSNSTGPTLNLALKRTGQLHLFFGALFAISLCLG